ncbi:MAG: TolB protein [Acidobacteriota bacterium]|jgi:hypothetical protein|nr:TolB protein [Acidobacteriota bacterium]
MAEPNNPKLQKVRVKGCVDYLRRDIVAPAFLALREEVFLATGGDFLDTCGDIFRDKSFKQNNPGSVTRSPHKLGVAFDYNQGAANLLLKRELDAGKVWWRTYLICKQQDGSQGTKVALVKTDNAGTVKNKYLLDFTATAAKHGFGRIHAKAKWQTVWTRREFWHYEHKEVYKAGYNALMNDLYGVGGWKA